METSNQWKIPWNFWYNETWGNSKKFLLSQLNNNSRKSKDCLRSRYDLWTAITAMLSKISIFIKIHASFAYSYFLIWLKRLHGFLVIFIISDSKNNFTKAKIISHVLKNDIFLLLWNARLNLPQEELCCRMYT